MLASAWTRFAVLALLLGLGGVPGETPVDAPEGDAPVDMVSEPLEVVDPEGVTEPGVVEPASDEEAELTAPADPVIALSGEHQPRSADHVIVGLTHALETSGSDVTVIGASWEPVDTAVRVHIRLLRDGTWGDWETLAVDHQVEGEGSRFGTEPYVVSEGEDVQVRLMTDDGSIPAGARLDVFGVDVTSIDFTAPSGVNDFGMSRAEGTAQSGAAQISGVTAPQPTIQLREAWGAKEPTEELLVGEVRGVTVHHTAGSNTYTQAEVPGVILAIQRYHMVSRGWADIGYNFLIDRYGGIWEGRYGGILNTTRGVHASSFNSITTGVSVMGNFETVAVSTAARNALVALMAWKLALHGVGAAGRMWVDDQAYPAIVGHRDVPEAATACPGRNLYSLLPSLRIATAQRQGYPRGLTNHDFNADGIPDLLRPPGVATTYLGTGDPFASRRQIGNGWGGMDLIVGSPAFRGGRTIDLVARQAATGRLYVYHGDGRGGFAGRTVLGTGWNAMSAVIAPGDWTGDGLPDLIAIHRPTGYLYLYRGNGRGAFLGATQIGHGWGGIRSVAAVGDLTGDGVADLVAIVAATSELRIYPGSGRGGFLPVRTLGGEFTEHDAVVGIGDVTGDGHRDVLVRNAVTGGMVTVSVNGRGGRIATRTWGSEWNGRGSLVAAPNWNGNGLPVLITFDQTSGLLYSYETSRQVAYSTGGTIDLSAATTYAVIGDMTGSGAASLVSRDVTGLLYLHEARGDGTFAPPRLIGHGWNAMQQIATAGDFDHDGFADVLALSDTGELRVYPARTDGSGGLDLPYIVGVGFGDYRVFGVGGWSRNTHADVLAIHQTTGQLRWYTGHSRGGLTGGVQIGSGWQHYEVVAVGDVTGSGNNDLLARHIETGEYYIYPGNGAGGFATRQAVVGVPAYFGGPE